MSLEERFENEKKIMAMHQPRRLPIVDRLGNPTGNVGFSGEAFDGQVLGPDQEGNLVPGDVRTLGPRHVETRFLPFAEPGDGRMISSAGGEFPARLAWDLFLMLLTKKAPAQRNPCFPYETLIATSVPEASIDKLVVAETIDDPEGRMSWLVTAIGVACLGSLYRGRLERRRARDRAENIDCLFALDILND